MALEESPFNIITTCGGKTTVIPVEYHGKIPEEVVLENGMKFRPITKLIDQGEDTLLAINPFTDVERLISTKTASLIRLIEIKTQNGIDSVDNAVELKENDNAAYMAFID